MTSDNDQAPEQPDLFKTNAVVYASVEDDTTLNPLGELAMPADLPVEIEVELQSGWTYVYKLDRRYRNKQETL